MKKQQKSLKQRFKEYMPVLTGMAIGAYVFYINMIYAYAVTPGAGGGGGGSGGAERFDAVIEFLVPWIEKLGGVVMLIGGVMFALGFKNDDADSKTRGLQTMVAGGITIAVGAGYRTFIG